MIDENKFVQLSAIFKVPQEAPILLYISRKKLLEGYKL